MSTNTVRVRERVARQPAGVEIIDQPTTRTVIRERTRLVSGATGLFNGKTDEPEESAYEQEMKSYASKQILDPFEKAYSTLSPGAIGTIMRPPYTPDALLRLPNMNNMLKQCIDAYVINIESFGTRFEYIGPETDDNKPGPEAEAELEQLQAFVDNPNGLYTMIELRQRLRRDIETFGYGFMEVGRDEQGNVDALYHVPAHTVRLLTRDSKAVPIEQTIVRGKKTVKKKRMINFRRYVQDVNGSKVYFKELGDPRIIDPASGKESPSIGFEDQATELVHVQLYSPGDVYGVPRWINQLASVLGSREAELVNLQFFKDNAIPAMAVLVSGGTLSAESVTEVKAKFTARRGVDNMNRVVVLEAVGDQESASEAGQTPAPRIDIKPLASERQSDGNFLEYNRDCAKAIRSSFRLPPIFVGLSDDMTHATAQSSLVITENQVFGPERNKLDDLFNQHLLLINGQQPKFWRMRSAAPRVTNPEDVSDALRNLNLFGAMSPNEATMIANELFDLKMPQSEDAWAKYPFDLVLAIAASGRLKGVEEIQGSPDDALPTPAANDGTKPAKKEGVEKQVEDFQERLVKRRTRHIREVRDMRNGPRRAA
jgi:PBSX family phage portal protein